MTHALLIVGTRPEAIKLAPVVKQLRSTTLARSVVVCVSGQHAARAREQLIECGVTPDLELPALAHPLSLSALFGLLLDQLGDVVQALRPRLVIVQGDTATAAAGAVAAGKAKVPVAHVEAGLRTGSLAAPFPEEGYRRLLARIAELHFAPTAHAVRNLVQEGVPPGSILLTGNTGVDAFHDHADGSLVEGHEPPGRRIVVSLHRREVLGERMTAMFEAISVLAERYPAFEFLCQINANPAVSRAFDAAAGACGRQNMTRVAPLSYRDCLRLLARSYFIMTDSGGIQEEAPLLGKPVLVLRRETDRPEGLATGGAKLVGISPASIIASSSELIENRDLHARMAHVHSPYGDGHASRRISETIVRRLTHSEPPARHSADHAAWPQSATPGTIG